MTNSTVLWVALGGVAGVAHAAALWHTAHHWTHPSLASAWRIPAVVAVLAAAALSGVLLPAVGGWAGGLAGAGALLTVRSRR